MSIKFHAQYGYIVTATRDRDSTCPISSVDIQGNYQLAIPDSVNGVPMAVYPTAESADEAVKRAAGDTDPLVYDGLRVVTLQHTKNQRAIQCAIYGAVSYPEGKPARTDYESPAFLGSRGS